MHYGILAADLSWPALHDSLAALTGRFIAEGPVTDLNSVELGANDSGWRLLAGEHDGKAFLLDTSMMLSMAGYDAIAEIARTTGALVIGCGAETVSGSYSFFAARGPHILRWYNHCHSAVSRPFEFGTPLPTERESPFCDLDGDSFFKALRHFGFQYEQWLQLGTRYAYQYTADELSSGSAATSLVLQGPLATKAEEHFQRFALAPGDVPPLTVVTRDGRTGQVIGEASADVSLFGARRPKSLLRRLFERLF
jgi:hypothetical protein